MQTILFCMMIEHVHANLFVSLYLVISRLLLIYIYADYIYACFSLLHISHYLCASAIALALVYDDADAHIYSYICTDAPYILSIIY